MAAATATRTSSSPRACARRNSGPVLGHQEAYTAFRAADLALLPSPTRTW
ncbi:hypothetical protein [Streptomyces sp. NPDC046939]